MEQDDAAEALAELRERRLSARELLQAAAGSGLAAYAVWALLLQPGFRRVPLRLQVPYVGASARQVEHVLSLLRGRPGKTVDLGSGDGRIVLAAHRCGLRPAVGYELNPWLVGLSRLHAWRAGCAGAVCYRREDLWKVSLSDCHNVSVFLAPSVTMARLTDALGPCRTPPHHRLLLLLLGLAWMPQPVQTQQLRCLARRLMELGVPKNLDAFPPELLPFLNPATLSWPGACADFFSHIAEAHVDKLPRTAPERRRLLSYALACRGVWGSRVTAADVRALGGLACDLPGRFVASSAEVLLPRLAGCPGPLNQDQQEAARAALQGGGPPYGPPSTWSVSTLGALRGLLAVLDPPISHSIPKGVISAWLHHTVPDPPRRQPEQALVHPRLRRDTKKAACPPGRKPTMVDERLFFYEDWELRACVDGALLGAQMDRVNLIPFTYEQLAILKSRLDEFYPQGYPEALARRLGYFFLSMKPADVLKWNITSLDTVLALLSVSKGQGMDAQVAALVSRYMLGRNSLDWELLDALTGFRPTYLCALSPEQLQQVQPSVLWAVGPGDLDACGPGQLGVLYPKALSAFRNVSGPEHSAKILFFLAGASTDDLRALSRENVSLDVAAFRRLRAEVVAPLTVAEVRGLLGAHVVDLKGAEEDSPVRDWVFRQPQAELDTLQLGLLGGIPDGYLVLDLSFQEAHARAPARLGPGCLLATMPALLLFLTPR